MNKVSKTKRARYKVSGISMAGGRDNSFFYIEEDKNVVFEYHFNRSLNGLTSIYGVDARFSVDVFSIVAVVENPVAACAYINHITKTVYRGSPMSIHDVAGFVGAANISTSMCLTSKQAIP